ncbi:acyltransferase family protein [Gluconacetobacter azotocaptans]|uniref:acyltransferase family protein n=1 Tax=Gluconacetobacter azotocaptans TaxID=142834 RepID=UPI001C8001A2|nr:acyltransferase [Gluconacetobacter azotocaptans]
MSRAIPAVGPAPAPDSDHGSTDRFPNHQMFPLRADRMADPDIPVPIEKKSATWNVAGYSWRGGAPRPMLFPFIDVLRGFAAISVVVYHVIMHFNWTGFPTSGPLVWFRTGWMGVDLFFVISGFVISLSAFGTLDKTADTRKFLAHFARHRALRIVPLHYATCLVFVVYIYPFMFFSLDGWKQFATHILFIHNFFLMHQGGINGVNWSLGDEVQFYILIMLTAFWLRQCPPWVIGVGAVAIAWTWRFFIYRMTDISGPLGVFPRFAYATELPGMLDEFACGILLARFVRTKTGASFIASNPMRLWAFPAATLMMGTISFLIYWHNAAYWDSAWMVVGYKTLFCITCGLLVMSACSFNQKSLILISAPLRYLGTISYGIYLWHLSIIEAFKKLGWLSGPQALPAILILTIVFASASWHFFERPITQRFARRLSADAARTPGL